MQIRSEEVSIFLVEKLNWPKNASINAAMSEDFAFVNYNFYGLSIRQQFHVMPIFFLLDQNHRIYNS